MRRDGWVDDSDVDKEVLRAKNNLQVALAVVKPVVLAGVEPCSSTGVLNEVGDGDCNVVVANAG